MKLLEFYKLYWEQYQNLKDEFVKTLNYVSLEEDNYNTYSNAYI